MVEPLLAALAVVLVLSLTHFSGRLDVGRVVQSLARRLQDARLAPRRAEVLLLQVLTAQEYAMLADRGYLYVLSPSRPERVYRVPRDCGIVVIRERGRVVGGLCVQSVVPFPAADTVAMHKLMIEGAEDEYLRTANHLSVGAMSRNGLGVLEDR
jgi:hypothetical protein